MLDMKRRFFIILLGGAAVVWPLAARAASLSAFLEPSISPRLTIDDRISDHALLAPRSRRK